jgi:hypothetical protein
MVALRIAQYMKDVRDMQDQLTGGEGPDPVVALKEQELQIRAAKDQAGNQIDQQRLALDEQRLQHRAGIDEQRLALQAAKLNMS